MQGPNFPQGDSGINDVYVSSWNELSDRLYALAVNPALERLRSRYVFRGLPEVSFGLVTTLAGWALSRVRIGNPRKRPQVRAGWQVGLGTETSYWNWLALAQHHGLSTRLLEWTYSSFVALHLVTDRSDRFDTDGVI